MNAEKCGFRRRKVVSYGTIAYVGMELNQPAEEGKVTAVKEESPPPKHLQKFADFWAPGPGCSNVG